MAIFEIGANSDNWMYVLADGPEACAAVDPSDATVLRAALRDKGLGLTAVLATHHHADHIGGIAPLKKAFGCTVYSPDPDRIPGTDVCVQEGDCLVLGNWTLTAMATPGHTTTSVCYYGAHPDEPPILFSGDTLFAVGCGRLFDGSAETLYRSLRRLADLPDATRMYPGHDYTEENLLFALNLEPDSKPIKQMLDRIRTQKQFRPTTLAEEKQCNPFLRCDRPALQRAIGLDDPVEVFAEIRRRKDRF